jgi:hypothetical protein
MRKTARFFLVTTAIVVGILYAGARRADADFIQTNLVSAGSPPSPTQNWSILGCVSYRHEPFLDFEPGYQYSHSLRGDGQQ